MIRVKICGITRASDLRAAVEAGASALGFVFAKSPRRVGVPQARRLIGLLPPWVSAVGVFVNEDPRKVLSAAQSARLDCVQLHGDEPESDIVYLKKRGLRVIRAIRVGENGLKSVRTAADAVLLDTSVKGVYGGSGKSFDWSVLRRLRCDKPVIVSGGLKPSNVASLLKKARPYGVDVSSGVETSPGKKNGRLIKEFMEHVQ